MDSANHLRMHIAGIEMHSSISVEFIDVDLGNGLAHLPWLRHGQFTADLKPDLLRQFSVGALPPVPRLAVWCRLLTVLVSICDVDMGSSIHNRLISTIG